MALAFGFVAFLVLVVLGESRIEPLRTVEVVENPLPGPGSLYLLVLLALALALGVALFLGKALFANLLALFTPYQKAQLLPSFFFCVRTLPFWGASPLAEAAPSPGAGAPRGLGGGFWVGPALVLALFAYGLVRPFLGFPTLPLHLLVFLGLALMEPFFRGLAPWAFGERYRDLAPYLSALFFALAVPGPTFFLLLLGAGLLWAKERAGSVVGVALGWVVAGVVLALFPPTWLRRF